jgi:hypothetical protein
MGTQKQGRAAARAAGAMLVVRAGVLFSWELYEVLGADPPPTSDQLYAVFWGVVALWFAVILLVRVGYWPKPRAVRGRAHQRLGDRGPGAGGSDSGVRRTGLRRRNGQPDHRAAGFRGRALRATGVAQERGNADAERLARRPNPNPLHRPAVAPVPAAAAAALTTSHGAQSVTGLGPSARWTSASATNTKGNHARDGRAAPAHRMAAPAPSQ